MRHFIAMTLSRGDCSARIRTVSILSVAAILAMPGIASAATFMVNSTIDAADGAPGDGQCETVPGNGVCTLRAAIDESNAVPGLPPAQIDLPPGAYGLTLGALSISGKANRLVRAFDLLVRPFELSLNREGGPDTGSSLSSGMSPDKADTITADPKLIDSG